MGRFSLDPNDRKIIELEEQLEQIRKARRIRDLERQIADEQAELDRLRTQEGRDKTWHGPRVPSGPPGTIRFFVTWAGSGR